MFSGHRFQNYLSQVFTIEATQDWRYVHYCVLRVTREGSEKMASAAEGSSVVVVSVVENRAREICIAQMDSRALSSIDVNLLTSDSHGYSETIQTLQMISPQELLLHDAQRNSVLSRKIEAHFGVDGMSSNCRVIYISRQYFDQDRGLEMLKNTVAGYVDRDLLNKYTVLAGTFCLLRYMENVQSINFARNSVRLVFRNSSFNRMAIDRGTAMHLELVSNLEDGNQKQSLFGALNKCKTSVGSKFLKVLEND